MQTWQGVWLTLLIAITPTHQAHYPELMKDVKIRVIELMDHVLSTYDRKIGEYTAERFSRAGMVRVLASLPCPACSSSASTRPYMLGDHQQQVHGLTACWQAAHATQLMVPKPWLLRAAALQALSWC